MSLVLPIEPVLPALREALAEHPAAVLQAPPGAGKTTRVPLALLDAGWLAGQKLVMLEPRRLAARAAARRMAALLGERVGETVGYRVRMDTRVGPRTRVEVVTEGVLTRMLHADPSLEGVGLVVFDEFHERSLQADLGLALTLQARQLLRPDLRLLVMSATLDGAPVARLLGDAPVVTSEGKSFPVETHYLARPVEGRIEGAVAAGVRRALAEAEGDVLAFLPGAAEIRRTEARLLEGGLPDGVFVAPLYGALPAEAQDRAVAPAPAGQRKVVLATDIAETSLTIEGVRAVVDGGLARRPRFDPRSGMTGLVTVRVSRSSADQRRGRAGRTAPGVCYRLWTKAEHARLAPFAPPEILEADLAPLALDLAAWGAAPEDLAWLDPPPPGPFAQARDLLAALGALDHAGRLTDHGRRMAGLALHPRLAHMLLRAQDLGLGAGVAALLGARDPLRRAGPQPPDVDLRLRFEALRSGRAPGHEVDRGALARIREEARHWRRRLGDGADGKGGRDGGETPDPHPSPSNLDQAGVLLALAYPDRIAERRAPGRFRLRNGRAARLPDHDPLADAPYLAVADLDSLPRSSGARGGEARVFLAAPLTREEIEAYFADQIETEDAVMWDVEAGRVRARRLTRLGAVVLREAPLATPDPDTVAGALVEGVRQSEGRLLPWTRAARGVQERVLFLRHHLGDAWPDLSDAALLATLDDWLRPYLAGCATAADLARLDLASVLLDRLDGPQRAALDRLAPTHLTVPSGSRIPLDYTDPAAPVLAVRLQEVFGMTETPRLAGGCVPVLMHLLSPAGRPVQVTRDLASFWRDAYFDVRKDLRGRYPKHHWPEDPLAAEPTARAKRRGQ
ncbi:MAG TPA: ATP-dependent helicase HrpB [Rubricoccaceae bacterium]|nr:ATP-dependent helicase HrpB [Rubricoccaceae bacterium]